MREACSSLVVVSMRTTGRGVATLLASAALLAVLHTARADVQLQPCKPGSRQNWKLDMYGRLQVCAHNLAMFNRGPR